MALNLLFLVANIIIISVNYGGKTLDHIILLGKILSQEKPKGSILINGSHIKITLELDKINYNIETLPGTIKARLFSTTKVDTLKDIIPKECSHKRGVNTITFSDEIKDKKSEYSLKIVYDFKKQYCTFHYKKITILNNGTGINELKGKIKLRKL